MYVEDLRIIKPSTYGPYTTIQAAIQAALTSVPPSAVMITPEYAGTDTYTNASGVTIIDLRQGATNTGIQFGNGTGAVIVGGVAVTNGTNSVKSGVVAVAAVAANITASTGGTFVTTLNAPGAGALESVPFTVKASGFVTFPAGTYTASIQPLLYASSLAGYTASAAAAIYSAAAISITFASATLPVTKPYSIEAHLIGDSTGNYLTGWTQGVGYVGGAALTNAILANTIIVNPVTVFTASSAAPVQFQFGIVGTNTAAVVLRLGSFFLEV